MPSGGTISRETLTLKRDGLIPTNAMEFNKGPLLCTLVRHVPAA